MKLKGKQLELFDVEQYGDFPPYCSSNLREAAHQHFIEKYYVERGAVKYWYFRYTWMVKRKMDRCYIGSTTSPKAIAISQIVKEMIESDRSPTEIINKITKLKLGVT